MSRYFRRGRERRDPPLGIGGHAHGRGGGGERTVARSRSRENNSNRQSGRYDGRGRNMNPAVRRPSEVEVKLNMFKLSLLPTATNDCEWMQYDMKIRRAKRVMERDENGNVTKAYTVSKSGTAGEDPRMKSDESTPLSRRIFRKLQENIYNEENRIIVSDGSCSAYAPRRLFSGSFLTSGDALESQASSANGDGIYGPADRGNDTASAAQELTRNSKIYDVRVKKNCDDKDPEADRVPNAWFQVQLTEVRDPIPFETVFGSFLNKEITLATLPT